MSNPIYNLAFDFGASSGRMILSKTEDGKITLEELHRFSNDPVRIGLLCRLTANAIGKPVIAGPVEGSVLGNITMQLKAMGHIADRIEGRKIIRASFEQKIYQPE